MPKTLHDTLKLLVTEQVNSASKNIDKRSVRQILAVINNEDARVAAAVKKEIPAIEKAVNIVVHAFKNGGRLIYVGAGTSGRLGIVDASECPPTFGTPPGMVTGVIAGGNAAVFRSQEGAEDFETNGAAALREIHLTKKDVVCGIAASARTPFVIGAVKHARKIGAKTLYITTNPRTILRTLGVHVDAAICPQVGAEVIMGSTRMKSGTAQKLVLNMITTTAMIRLGKVYGNLMVDLQMTNRKLEERSKRIVSMVTGVDYNMAEKILREAGGNVKTAIVMILADVDAKGARKRLDRADGFIRSAIK